MTSSFAIFFSSSSVRVSMSSISRPCFLLRCWASYTNHKITTAFASTRLAEQWQDYIQEREQNLLARERPVHRLRQEERRRRRRDGQHRAMSATPCPEAVQVRDPGALNAMPLDVPRTHEPAPAPHRDNRVPLPPPLPQQVAASSESQYPDASTEVPTVDVSVG